MPSVLWIVVTAVASSALTALVMFGVLWYFWLRHLLYRLYLIHRSLQEMHESLAKNLKREQEQTAQHLVPVDTLISPEERERILRYLRAEGFLP